MNIKVCGITQLKQLQQLEGLNIDFAGLIFSKDSSGYIEGQIDKAALKSADFDLKKTGVFVNPELIDVLDAIDGYGLDVVQLHGNESAEMCEDLSGEVEVIKTLRVEANSNIDEMLAEYDGVCDYYLFEAAGNKPGGNEKKFDWKLLNNAKIEKPFFFSGGIGVDDIEALKKFNHPDFFGVDINSRFDKSPGVKDMALILKFWQGLKNQ